MKIVYLHQYFKFPNENGGTRSYDLAVEFVNSGNIVEVITTTNEAKFKGKKRWHEIKKDNLTIHYIFLPYSNEMSFLSRTFAFLKFILFSTFKLLKIKCDIVIATSTPLTIGIPAIIKKKLSKTPFIFEVRDVWPEAVISIGAVKNYFLIKLLLFLEKIIYKNASAIVPLSSDMKNSIQSRFPSLVEKKPITVIENISEINRFQDNYSAEKSIIKEKLGFKPKFSILYAGTFGKVNGLDYLVTFAEEIFKIDQEIVFILIGEGIEKKIIIDLAEKKGLLNKNIFLFNTLSKKELPQIYFEVNMGSSFVINKKELWSNSANKFFDTLAAAKPILINYEGWQGKIIKDKNIGYVLPSHLDIESVKDFISYTKQEDIHKIQSNNSLDIAQKEFSLTISSGKYLDLFQKVLKVN